MKKLFLAGICLVVFSGVLVGQNDSGKVKLSPSISISGGIGIPVSFGGASDFEPFALIGPSISISADILIKNSRFGIMGIFGYGSNGYDSSIAIGANQLTSISEGKYYEYKAMAGIFYSLPTKNISLDFRFLVGILYFITPGFTYTGESYSFSPNAPNYIGIWTVNEENTISFVMDVGASIKFQFTKKVFGTLSTDLIYSGLNGGYYTETKFTPIVSGNSYTAPYNYLYSSISLVTPSIGIGYKF